MKKSFWLTGMLLLMSLSFGRAAAVCDTISLTWTAEAGEEKNLYVGVDGYWSSGEKIYVDFGDGNRLYSEKAGLFTKIYEAAGSYEVKIATMIPVARIVSFYCSGTENKNNGVTSLDVSHCDSLVDLDCGYNQLKSLDLSACSWLMFLNCDTNRLSVLDVSKNLALYSLACGGNRLTSLDVSKNLALGHFVCSGNQLVALDLSQNEKLSYFYAGYNSRKVYVDADRSMDLDTLPGMDVSRIGSVSGGHIEGTRLFFDADRVTYRYATGYSGNRDIESVEFVLVAAQPPVTPPDVPEKPTYTACDTIFMTWTAEVGEEKPLRVGVSVGESWTAGQETFVVDWGDGTYLYAAYYGNDYEDTSFTKTYAESGSYDVMVYTTAPEVRMQRFYCNGTSEKSNGVSALDVSQNAALRELYCENNGLSALDVSGCASLSTLDCSYNGLSALDVSQNAALIRLSCYNNGLSALDVSQNAALEYLDCSYNGLSALDVSGCASLIRLSCYNNGLSALDVSQNAALGYLDCSYNGLSALDVSQNAALEYLDCSNNALSALDVSQNAALGYLDCSNNALSALDVSQNAALEYLDCSNNALSALDVSQNAALRWLYCANNGLSALDVSQNAALEILDCSSNALSALDVSQNAMLGELWCYNNALSALDLSQNAALTEMSYSNNRLIVDLDADRSMDLDTLPGMDVSRIGSVTGGYIDGTRLFFNADEVTYRYATHFPGDVSLGFDTVAFTLVAAQPPVTPPDDPIEPDTIVPGNGVGWIWLADAGEEKEIAFKGTGKGFRVDWGDSTTSEAKGAPGFDETSAAKDSDKKLEHRYAEEGVYTVTIEPLSESGRLTDLDVSDGRLVALRFGDASMLTDLDCSENLLTELDLSGAAKLKALDCSENLLPSLDLTACAQLQEADFSENRLSVLALPTHSNLKSIDGKDNRLSLSGLYDLLSQRVKKASYGFDPQGDSVSVAAGDVLDLSSEMLLGGKSTAYTVYDADGRPASKADYTETGGQFRFTEAGRCYRLSLTNAAVMEYKDGNPQKPVTFVLNVIVPGVGNEELTGSDACVYVRNRTICLSEDLGEMRVYTILGRCIYKGHGLEAEVPCAGLYVVQAGGHTWKVVVR